MPGRAADMSDGWETKRRRGPGHDWCVVQLGARGRVRRVEVDTAHFKGNFPESFSLEVCAAPQPQGLAPGETYLNFAEWRELLPRTRLQAHTRHFYEAELSDAGVATHALFRIYPDGGVSRLRLYGSLAEDA
jgi:allantoicase